MKDAKIVLDCSGSMAGAAIAYAQGKALEALARLKPQDRFAMVAFGKVPVTWRPTMCVASKPDVEAASAWIRERAADMGDTDLSTALHVAMAIDGAGEACDVLVFTDGQVSRTWELTNAARSSGHRFLIVGLGPEPKQDPLGHLAESSGGTIEWIVPGGEESDVASTAGHARPSAPDRDVGAPVDTDEIGFPPGVSDRALGRFLSKTIAHYVATPRKHPLELTIRHLTALELPARVAGILGKHMETHAEDYVVYSFWMAVLMRTGEDIIRWRLRPTFDLLAPRKPDSELARTISRELGKL